MLGVPEVLLQQTGVRSGMANRERSSELRLAGGRYSPSGRNERHGPACEFQISRRASELSGDMARSSLAWRMPVQGR